MPVLWYSTSITPQPVYAHSINQHIFTPFIRTSYFPQISHPHFIEQAYSQHRSQCVPTPPSSTSIPSIMLKLLILYTYWRYCLWMRITKNEQGKTYIVRLHWLKTVAFAWTCTATVHQHKHLSLSGSGASVFLCQRVVVDSVTALGGRFLPGGPGSIPHRVKYLVQLCGPASICFPQCSFYWYCIPTADIVFECMI